MNGTAVEPVAKPSAHGRSEIFPAMNRLLTRAGNVRFDGGQLRDGTAPSSFALEPPLFFSVFPSPSCSYPAIGPKRQMPGGLARSTQGDGVDVPECA